MPIVRIDIQDGKSTIYKRELLSGVREAVTGALGLPNERVMLRIVETPAEDIDAGGGKSDRLTIISISMVAGRGPELKAELYRSLSRRLGFEPGIAEEDLVIVVNDPGGECFYLDGSIPGTGPAAPGNDSTEVKA